MGESQIKRAQNRYTCLDFTDVLSLDKKFFRHSSKNRKILIYPRKIACFDQFIEFWIWHVFAVIDRICWINWLSKKIMKNEKKLVLVRENSDIFSACCEAALHHLRLFNFSEKVSHLRHHLHIIRCMKGWVRGHFFEPPPSLWPKKGTASRLFAPKTKTTPLSPPISFEHLKNLKWEKLASNRMKSAIYHLYSLYR